VQALPLQLVLRTRRDWRDAPVVVVADDRPQAPVLWANARARGQRILPGMTFAAARNLASTLRADVVESSRLDAAVEELTVALCNFSPRVEPAPGQPGVFFIDPSGLVPLYGSYEHWAHCILAELSRRELSSTVVVGFHRFRTYALARTRQGAWVLPDARHEARLAARVPLSHLDIDPRTRDGLYVLGVKTLGDLLALPAAELRTRFGEAAARLHADATDRWAPLQPRPLSSPVRAEVQFEPPDDDHHRLLFSLRGTLHELMGRLVAKGQAMSALHITLQLDHAPDHDTFLEPAAPTVEVPLVVDLMRLRLESMRLPAGVEGMIVQLEGVRATQRQLALFRSQQKRDLDAAGRALARLRARFGPSSVTRARLRAAHLPEAAFGWEPIGAASFPDARPLPPDRPAPLCRRVHARPLPLPPRPRHEPEAWLGRRGAVKAMHGPYRVSGGWWVRTVERDYYYAETQHGEILWLFYDRPRRRWFLHGEVD
jgi:protein ImuB